MGRVGGVFRQVRSSASRTPTGWGSEQLETGRVVAERPRLAPEHPELRVLVGIDRPHVPPPWRSQPLEPGDRRRAGFVVVLLHRRHPPDVPMLAAGVSPAVVAGDRDPVAGRDVVASSGEDGSGRAAGQLLRRERLRAKFVQRRVGGQRVQRLELLGLLILAHHASFSARHALDEKAGGSSTSRRARTRTRGGRPLRDPGPADIR